MIFLGIALVVVGAVCVMVCRLLSDVLSDNKELLERSCELVAETRALGDEMEDLINQNILLKARLGKYELSSE